MDCEIGHLLIGSFGISNGQGRRYDWTEGRVELYCNHNKALANLVNSTGNSRVWMALQQEGWVFIPLERAWNLGPLSFLQSGKLLGWDSWEQSATDIWSKGKGESGLHTTSPITMKYLLWVKNQCSCCWCCSELKEQKSLVWWSLHASQWMNQLVCQPVHLYVHCITTLPWLDQTSFKL